jgi:hypothetical protein
VFEQRSKSENMILTLLPKKTPDIKELSLKLIGNNVLINWPYLKEAMVIGLVNSKVGINFSDSLTNPLKNEMNNLVPRALNEKYLHIFNSYQDSINEM